MEKIRILIIDDETTFTRLLKLNLESTDNFEVLEENKGVRALTTALEFKPALVLLDVMMPDKDGGDIATNFKAHPNLKDVPIIFLTATVKKQEVDAKGGLIGGFLFVAKPVSLDELKKCIKESIKTPSSGNR